MYIKLYSGSVGGVSGTPMAIMFGESRSDRGTQETHRTFGFGIVNTHCEFMSVVETLQKRTDCEWLLSVPPQA